jgi:hypothetical protein
MFLSRCNARVRFLAVQHFYRPIYPSTNSYTTHNGHRTVSSCFFLFFYLPNEPRPIQRIECCLSSAGRDKWGGHTRRLRPLPGLVHRTLPRRRWRSTQLHPAEYILRRCQAKALPVLAPSSSEPGAPNLPAPALYSAGVGIPRPRTISTWRQSSTIRTTCHWWRSKARSFTWFSLPSNNTMRSGSGCLRVTRRVAPSGRQGTDIVVRLWEGRPPVRNIARSFISLRLLCSALSGIVQMHNMLVSDKICITETWVRDLDAWWLYLVIGWVVAHCFSWESRRLAIY